MSEFNDIDEKMKELEFRLSEMETLHDKFIRAVHHDDQINVRPFEGESGEFARLFRYAFSAFLTVHRTIRYYIIRKSGKVPQTTAWREGIDDQPILDALHHIRDVDIHDEIPEAATTLKVQGIQTQSPTVTIDPIRLAVGSLEKNPRFKNKRATLEYIARYSILDIAREGLKELQNVVQQGRQLGFI